MGLIILNGCFSVFSSSGFLTVWSMISVCPRVVVIGGIFVVSIILNGCFSFIVIN